MQDSSNSQSQTAAQVLSQIKDQIIASWEQKVRSEIRPASEIQHPLLVNTLPGFLENLAHALSPDDARKLATESSSIAREHGGERARLTAYRPDQLLREYQLLRNEVFVALRPKVLLSAKDQDIIQKSFDEAIQQAMMAFFLVHSRLREQFVASISHDLRNPLGAVKMAAELIQSAAFDLPASEARDDIEGLARRILNNAKRADRMIQDLLDASALQVGERVQLRILECELMGIIKEVISELDRKHQSRIQFKGSPIWGYWDPDALRRTVENLVSNAFKYGSPDRPVTITLKPGGGRVQICVHNEGPPIPLEEQEVLFQPFRRSEAAKQSGHTGWGVGLALVRGVVEGHGGSVGINSLSTGTTFIVDIPVDARPYLSAPTL